MQNNFNILYNRILSSLILNVDKNLSKKNTEINYKLLENDYGYFNDYKGATYKNGKLFDTNFLTTPLYKIQSKITKEIDSSDKELVVLFSSCGCAPMHEGHLNMFFEAREALESSGKYKVIGGYISPDHEDYTIKKNIKEYSAMDKLLAAQKLCDTTDWVDIDPWGSIYLNTDINYTTNIDRIEEYLNKHIYTIKPIKVAYVYGSDHTSFSRSFIGRGIGVCVLRKQSDLSDFNEVKKELKKYNDRIFFVNPTNKKYLGLSSTEIRKMTQPIKQNKKLKLYYRDDIDWYIETVGKETVEYYKQFVENVKEILRKYDVELHTINDIPRKDLNIDEEKSTPIYLTGCPSESHNCLYVSRLFAVSSYNQNNISFVTKPSKDSLEVQFEKMKKLCKKNKDEKYLVEDDIATGRTIQFVSEKLKDVGCKVSDKIKVDIDLREIKTEQNESVDLLDFRDLIVGIGSGLVVLLPSGEMGRAPYLLPYVNSGSRIGFNNDFSKEFSKLIWKENYKLFKNIEINGNKIFKVSDCKSPAVKLLEYISFNNNSSLSDICKYHYELLE
jgi:hypothetical protein